MQSATTASLSRSLLPFNGTYKVGIRLPTRVAHVLYKINGLGLNLVLAKGDALDKCSRMETQVLAISLLSTGVRDERLYRVHGHLLVSFYLSFPHLLT